MSVWSVIAFAAVTAAVLALLAPHVRFMSVEALHLFGLPAVDGTTSRRAATLALTPVAVASIVVSLLGLVMNQGGPGSGVTSLIALLLVGVALIAGNAAARRTKAV